MAARSTSLRRLLVAAAVAWLGGSLAGPSLARAETAAVAPSSAAAASATRDGTDPDDYVQPAPAAFAGIDVEEKRGASVPLDLAFVDDAGTPVTLASYFADGLPVVLTFNYSNCPQLCSVQLNALTDTLGKSGYAPGWHYHLITVILNPRESIEGIAATKAKYVEHLPAKLQDHARRGWHFLLGDEATIHRLADAVGFRYEYLPDVGQYAHPALLTFLSSHGLINRYVHGLSYEAAEYDISVAFAGNDTPQESAGFLHRCFAWDSSKNDYTGMARALMRYAAAGFLTLLVAGFGLRQIVRKHGREAVPAAFDSPDTDAADSDSTKVTKESLP